MKNSPSVANAINLFSDVIQDMNLATTKIKGVNEPLYVKHMTHPLAWLAPWMIRSDEMSVMITGKRMWHSFYVANNKAVEGVEPRDWDVSQKEKLTNYSRFPIHEDLPVSLKHAIASATVSRSLLITNGRASILPIVGFYGIETALENDEIFPFANDISNIFANELKTLLRTKIRRNMRIAFEQAVELSHN